MSNTSLSSLINEIRPAVDGCPRAVILDAILKASIDFLKKSGAWRYKADPITVGAGINLHEIDIPAGTKIRTIQSATYAGSPLHIYEPDEIDTVRSNWRDEEGAGIDSMVPTDEPNEIQLIPKPTAALSHPIYITVTLALTRDASTIDSQVYEDWADVIRCGALCRLHGMPGKAWTNPTEEEKHRLLFNKGKSDARIVAMKGGVNGSIEMYRRDFNRIS